MCDIVLDPDSPKAVRNQAHTNSILAQASKQSSTAKGPQQDLYMRVSWCGMQMLTISL